MNRTLVRISPLSAAKIFGAMYLILGLVIVPFMLLPILFVRDASEVQSVGLTFALLMPILYGVMGFVGTASVCWFYNIVAARLGGIDVEVSGDEQVS